VRSVSAYGQQYLTGKTEDTVACLRGPVNRGAEKEKDLELPEKGLQLFKAYKQCSLATRIGDDF
jgi:hypothetical protein